MFSTFDGCPMKSPKSTLSTFQPPHFVFVSVVLLSIQLHGVHIKEYDMENGTKMVIKEHKLHYLARFGKKRYIDG